MKVLSVKVPIYTNDFEKTINDYEILLGAETQNKFKIQSIGISVARINDILIIGGNDEVLNSLPKISATFTVDSIDEYFDYLNSIGATILQPPTTTPTGKNMVSKNVDGIIFEYVELNGDD